MSAVGVFQQMDSDGDSQISREEFTRQYIARAREIKGVSDSAGEGAGSAQSKGHRFSVSNHSHRLHAKHGYTLEEFENGDLSLDQRAEILFNALDADGDGVVSVSEFVHAARSLASRQAAGGDAGSVAADGQSTAVFESLKVFQSMDKNGDSVLSLSEFRALLEREEIAVVRVMHLPRGSSSSSSSSSSSKGSSWCATRESRE